MKTTVKQIITASALTIMIASCGGKTKETASKETETAKPEFFKYEWVDVDLSKTKAKFPVIAKGRKGCITVNSSDFEAILENKDEITNYEIMKFESGMSQETKNEMKKGAKENDAYVFEKYIIDTPDSYIMKTSLGYMIGRYVDAGGNTYACTNQALYALKEEADAQELYKMMGMLKAK
jgi:hypothetical protein